MKKTYSKSTDEVKIKMDISELEKLKMILINKTSDLTETEKDIIKDFIG